MKVVILCGGKGERLREHTETIPKPLVEVGNKPILWHIMKIYSHYGYNNFVLCLGYKGDKIKEYFSKETKEKWNIEFVDTGPDTNTGGRIKKIEKYIDTDDFLATYGDGVSDINIKELIEFHKKQGKIVTMTCTNIRSNFGIVNIDDKNMVVGFDEKPFIDMWINGGFFVFNKKIFNYLDKNSILENQPLKQLAKERELIAFRYKGFWECMDTYKDTRVLNEMCDKGKAQWMVWDKHDKA
jgi:glucose-1-phosphate cytidylyltransferase